MLGQGTRTFLTCPEAAGGAGLEESRASTPPHPSAPSDPQGCAGSSEASTGQAALSSVQAVGPSVEGLFPSLCSKYPLHSLS